MLARHFLALLSFGAIAVHALPIAYRTSHRGSGSISDLDTDGSDVVRPFFIVLQKRTEPEGERGKKRKSEVAGTESEAAGGAGTGSQAARGRKVKSLAQRVSEKEYTVPYRAEYRAEYRDDTMRIQAIKRNDRLDPDEKERLIDEVKLRKEDKKEARQSGEWQHGEPWDAVEARREKMGIRTVNLGLGHQAVGPHTVGPFVQRPGSFTPSTYLPERKGQPGGPSLFSSSPALFSSGSTVPNPPQQDTIPSRGSSTAYHHLSSPSADSVNPPRTTVGRYQESSSSYQLPQPGPSHHGASQAVQQGSGVLMDESGRYYVVGNDHKRYYI